MKVEPKSSMTKIELTQGFYSIIDSEDFSRIAKYSWCLHKNGKQGKKYAATRTKNKYVLLHRLILDAVNSKFQVDHINGDTLDNRKQNLRLCSRSENLRNGKKHIDSKSKYKGVIYNKLNKNYRARICKDYKIIEIGSFKTEKGAAKAYDKKAIELFGSFAKLNFPKDI